MLEFVRASSGDATDTYRHTSVRLDQGGTRTHTFDRLAQTPARVPRIVRPKES